MSSSDPGAAAAEPRWPAGGNADDVDFLFFFDFFFLLGAVDSRGALPSSSAKLLAKEAMLSDLEKGASEIRWWQVGCWAKCRVKVLVHVQ